MNNQYLKEIRGLLEDLRKITRMTLDDHGVEMNSELSKSVRYAYTQDGIQLQVNYYYPFVSRGRKKGRRRASKRKGYVSRGIKRVPLDALIKFIKKNNITPRHGKTINQLAFAIQTSIYKNGIKAKNFEEPVQVQVTDYMAAASADIFGEIIANDLANMFK